MDILKPDLKLFKEKYDSGVKQVLFTSFAADVHTPISSLLKLEKEKYLFLFESVERGSQKGRYSVIGLKPDLIWECKNGISKIKKSNENIIIGGDFNIIPAAEDVHNPKSYENDALFRLEIRKKLRELINLGFHDAYRFIHPDKEGYTFWDYTSGAWQKNNGMRIDHFLVSNSLINLVKDVKINKYPRGRLKPSDHTPIEIELA